MVPKYIFLILSFLNLISLYNFQEPKTLIINGLIVTGKENESPFKGHIIISSSGRILDVIRETGTELNKLKSQYKDIETINTPDNENEKQILVMIERGYMPRSFFFLYVIITN